MDSGSDERGTIERWTVSVLTMSRSAGYSIALFDEGETGYRQPGSGRWHLRPLPATRRALSAHELCPFVIARGFVVSARSWGLLVQAEQPILLLSEGAETPTRRGRRVRVPLGAVARIGDIVIAPLDGARLEAARLDALRVPLHASAVASPWTWFATPWRPVAVATAALVATLALLGATVVDLGRERMPTRFYASAPVRIQSALAERWRDSGTAAFNICPRPMLQSGYIKLSGAYPNCCFGVLGEVLRD